MPLCHSPLSPEQLGRLLSGEVAEAEQAELSSHIEACEGCREALDRLAARSGMWDDLGLLRDDEIDLEIDADLALTGLFDPPEDEGQVGILGPYAILETIGRGGMGVVFLARDRTLDRLVAIKLMSPHLAASPSARRRFAREAKAAAAVVHEHVVTIHAVDVSPRGIPYLVMQYVAGKSAQDLVDGAPSRRVELEELLRIGSQVASGLAAAHEQGLIHRDVKPGNILLENGVERVKLTDFGLARAADDAAMTQSGVVAGTPQYMSPEQARGDALDTRSDLFSLGSVLYALATGLPPFRSRSSLATLKLVCDREPEPVSALRPDLPRWFAAILKRLHAKDPSQRYASAADVADLLTRCLAHVRRPNQNPLPAELAPKRPRRRLAAAFALGSLALLAATPALPAVRDAAERFAILLRIKTPEGTLVVETDDPAIGVSLDGSSLTITGAGLRELKIPVGPHQVRATKDGKVIKEELVHIEKHGKSVLSIRREAEDAPTLAEAARKPDLDSLNRRGRSSSKVEVLAHLLMLNSSSVRSPSAHSNVYMKNLDTGRTRRILEDFEDVHRITAVDWSGDGSRIAFERAPRQGEPAKSYAVRVSDGKIDLKEVATGSWPSLSPDGKQLATCVGGPETPKEIIISGSISSKNRRIPTDGIPRWSPEGDRILVASSHGEAGFTCRILDSNRERPIAFRPSRIRSLPQWSGDQTIVALVETRSRGLEIIEFDISQPDAPRELYRYWSFADTPGFTPTWVLPSLKDQTVYVLGRTADNRGRLLKVERKPNTLMTAVLSEPTPGALVHSACLSPDGKFLVYCEVTPTDQDRPAPAASAPATQLEPGQRTIRLDPAFAADRLVEAMGKMPVKPTAPDPSRMQIYLRDLRLATTRLALDEPIPGLTRVMAPEWSPDGSRVVFWGDSQAPPGIPRIILMELHDERVRFRDLGTGMSPVWSPDGRRIAFMNFDAPSGTYVMNADGTDRKRLTDRFPPTWSPDGKALLLNSFSEPTQSSLYDMETGRTRPLSIPGHSILSWPRWSAKDRLITALRQADGINLLAEVQLVGPGRDHILNRLWLPPDGQKLLPRWPIVHRGNGDVIFIGVEPSGDRQLYLLTNGQLAPIDPFARPDQLGGLTVSPGGRYLMFNANRDDRKASSKSSVAPTSEERVLDLPLRPAEPSRVREKSVAADTLLARQQTAALVDAIEASPVVPTRDDPGRSRVYLKDMAKNQKILVLDEPIEGLRWVGSPRWSMDGRSIVFAAGPDSDPGHSRILMMDAPKMKTRVRDLGPGSAPSLSPDGSKVAFRNAIDGKLGGVCTMNVDGTDRKPLNSFGVPSWSPDGKSLLISEHNEALTEPARARIYDLATGKEHPLRILDLPLASRPEWSAPNRLLAAVRWPGSTIKILEVDVTDPAKAMPLRTMWAKPADLAILPQSPMPRGFLDEVLFVGIGEKNTQFRRVYQVLEGSPTQIPTGAADTVADLACSPDGRYILFRAVR